MKIGYIKLFRKIQDHWLWKDKPFTKGQAWIDILMECNHTEQKVNIKNQIITCGIGESLNSLETWGKQWSWTKSKVRRFLKLLETDKMIEIIRVTSFSETQQFEKRHTKNPVSQKNAQKPTHLTTHLKVLNYSIYANKRNADETQAKRKRNADETQANINNNDKNDNNEKNVNNVYYESYKNLANEFLKYIKASQPHRLKSILGKKTEEQLIDNWCDVIDKLIRIDHYTLDEIIRACDYALNDDFWKTNFYSISKLRKRNKEDVMYIAEFLSRKELDKSKTEKAQDVANAWLKENKGD